jgi:hypothetical protein
MPSIQPKNETEPPSVRYGTDESSWARRIRSAKCSARPPAISEGNGAREDRAGAHQGDDREGLRAGVQRDREPPEEVGSHRGAVIRAALMRIQAA